MFSIDLDTNSALPEFTVEEERWVLNKYAYKYIIRIYSEYYE